MKTTAIQNTNPEIRVAQINEMISGGITISPSLFLLIVANKLHKSLGNIDNKLKGCINLTDFKQQDQP